MRVAPRATCTVHHAHLHGKRDHKYAQLAEGDLTTTDWKILQPQAPFYLFVPQDETLRAEYDAEWKITDIMPVNVLGFQSHRDGFAIDFEAEKLRQRIADMRNKDLSDAEFAERYQLKDSGSWQISKARQQLRADKNWDDNLISCAYRPFDTRWAYFNEAAMDRPRRELKENVAGKDNLCLNVVRQTKSETWQHAVVTDKPAPAVFVEIKDGSSVFPLYLYTSTDLFDQSAANSRRPNLAPEFIADLSARLNLTFLPNPPVGADLSARFSKPNTVRMNSHLQDSAPFSNASGGDTFTPEDVFHYAYAVFHSPAYRRRYAEFLKIDFPRLPLTRDVGLFRRLAHIGKTLVGLHLMEDAPSSPASGQGSSVRYPIAGDNVVEAVRYTAPPADEGSLGRVWINKTQYFDNVPTEVWDYHIGGYQVCQKWLKDRKGRQLGYDDLRHYTQIVQALDETLALQTQIDAEMPAWSLN